MSNGFYRKYGKRLFDLSIAVPALIVAGPVLAIVAVLVRIYLGSPVLFRQERPGRKGQLFRICKFRTMTDARDANGNLLYDDQRLTSFGKFLRASSLDELPELWNVLIGQMSLVGPRPLKVRYLPMYSPEQARRHDVTPGITGWAQINGRNAVGWEQRFLLDVWYVDNMSFWLDISILFKTFAAVFNRKGITAEGHVTMPDFEGTKKVVVIGAGGHGKVVVSTLQASGVVVDAIYDDNPKHWGTQILAVPVCGPISEISAAPQRFSGIIGIGHAGVRQRVAESLTIEWLTAVHPRAFVHPSVKLRAGTVVFAGAVLQPNVQIGSHVIVNTSASIDHDCEIGDFVGIGPGTHLSGTVRVGDRSLLGTGCSVLPNIKIESDVTVGAGTVVINDLPAGCTIVGPAPRIVRVTEPEQLRMPAQILGSRLPSTMPQQPLEKEFSMLNSPKQTSQTLALDGGTPVRSGPLSAWPYFDEQLIEAAAKTLRSNKVNYWTGEEGKLFEQEYAAAIGSKHAIALTNGTVALELALYGLGIGPGDEVIVPCRTFIASASCAVMRGATPVVADVDRNSQTLTAETIRAALTPRTKAIVAVHLAGWPCDLDPIMELAEKHGIKVIEDCAQSHHAIYKGRHVGTIGHVGAFSFCQDKIMTTGGEGGLMVTNDSELWDKCWSLKDHGKSLEAIKRPHEPHLFRWLHQGFGTNWRLTEMQSAMGRIMLRRLPEWVASRRRNAATLIAGLSSVLSLRIPLAPAHSSHSYYKFYAFVRPEHLNSGWTRDRIIQNLQAEGIPCGPGSCSEIYLENAFDGPGLRPSERLPVARELGETSLMFMVHPTLTAKELDDTIRAVKKVMAVAAKSDIVSIRKAA